MNGLFDKIFPEWLPVEQEPISECVHCGQNLFNGEDVFKDVDNNEVFCSLDCYAQEQYDNGVLVKTILEGVEDYED